MHPRQYVRQWGRCQSDQLPEVTYARNCQVMVNGALLDIQQDLIVDSLDLNLRQSIKVIQCPHILIEVCRQHRSQVRSGVCAYIGLAITTFSWFHTVVSSFTRLRDVKVPIL